MLTRSAGQKSGRRGAPAVRLREAARAKGSGLSPAARHRHRGKQPRVDARYSRTNLCCRGNRCHRPRSDRIHSWRSRRRDHPVRTIPYQHRSTMIGFILYLLIIGIVAGFLARLVVPGPDPMSVPQTILLGVVGSFIGGFLGYVIFGADARDGAFQASGIIGSVIGAVVALLIYRAVKGRRSLGRT